MIALPIQNSTPPRSRLESIDVVRGLIMILMALDHVRDFVGQPGASPTDLTQASMALFFTRWITNLCAPVFFLLLGTGAYLSLRTRSRGELSRFLVSRGLWLIFVEVVLMRCLGFQFNFDYHVTMLTVLWALGWAMIALAALVHLPVRWVAAFGVAMILLHNLLDAVRSANPLWLLLHSPGVVLSSPGHLVFEAYPVIPWIGVTAAGFGLGVVYSWHPDRRQRFLLRAGVAVSAAFLVLRGWNHYGDPSHWAIQSKSGFTLLSFLNTTKYPPSLLFLLMTLGPALLLLRLFDSSVPTLLKPAIVFGRVPMFYYLLHIPLIHVLALVLCFALYRAVHWMFESPTLGNFPMTQPPGWGLSLPKTYMAWVLVVALLYPLCRWFAGLKARRRDVWLSYL